MQFNWQLAYTTEGVLALLCVPEAENGKTYPITLSAWCGTLSNFCGEIMLLDDEETIELSNDDLFNLLSRLQQKTYKLVDGE